MKPPSATCALCWRNCTPTTGSAISKGSRISTPITTVAILEEANKLCRDVLLPINWPGDQEGCRIENGVVRTPKGFPEAYKQFCEGGWAGLGAKPA